MLWLARLWRGFVSGGGRVDLEDPNYLRVAMINVIGAVAAALWGLFLIRNLWLLPETGNTARVLVDTFGLGASLAMLLAIRLRVPVDIAARAANVAVLVAALALVYVRPDPAFSMMVLAIYPVLAFFLLDDVPTGIAWTTLATVLAAVMVLGGFGPWARLGPGGADGVGTILAVMVMQSATMAAYVRSRRQVLARLEQVRAELAEQSILDPLTGLHNRRTFDDALARYLSRAARGPDGLAVCMIDVDHFKAYNDTHGHPAGDDVLAAIADILGHVFARGEDLAFRIGGEELCVLFFAQGEADAQRMAERVCARVEALGYPSPGGPKRWLTVSIGLTWVPPGELHPPDAVYRLTDRALYRAKAAGRARLIATRAQPQEATPATG